MCLRSSPRSPCISLWIVSTIWNTTEDLPKDSLVGPSAALQSASNLSQLCHLHSAIALPLKRTFCLHKELGIIETCMQSMHELGEEPEMNTRKASAERRLWKALEKCPSPLFQCISRITEYCPAEVWRPKCIILHLFSPFWYETDHGLLQAWLWSVMNSRIWEGKHCRDIEQRVKNLCFDNPSPFFRCCFWPSFCACWGTTIWSQCQSRRGRGKAEGRSTLVIIRDPEIWQKPMVGQPLIIFKDSHDQLAILKNIDLFKVGRRSGRSNCCEQPAAAASAVPCLEAMSERWHLELDIWIWSAVEPWRSSKRTAAWLCSQSLPKGTAE